MVGLLQGGDELDAQAEQVARAANLDPNQVTHVKESIAGALQSRESMLEGLNFELVKARKVKRWGSRFGLWRPVMLGNFGEQRFT